MDINESNNQVEAYNDSGYAYFSKGDYDQAIKDYTEAIRLNPNGSALFFNRGLAHSAQGNNHLAIKDYTTAIELDPNNAQAYYNRGVKHEKNGDLEAITDYAAAKRINPNFAEAEAGFERMYKQYGHQTCYDAVLYESLKARQKKAEEAEKKKEKEKEAFWQSYNKEHGKDISLQDVVWDGGKWAYDGDVKAVKAAAAKQKGKEYFNEGDYDRAIAKFTEAIQLDPNDAAAYGSRGFAYSAKKDYGLAVRDIERAVELAPDNVEYREKLEKATKAARRKRNIIIGWIIALLAIGVLHYVLHYVFQLF